MIVMDTNVLSEVLRPAPEPSVLSWMAAQPRTALFTTTVTRAELLYGANLLPDGRRKATLLRAVSSIFTVDMARQVLSFDNEAADAYADIAAARQISGRPISQFDAMIAAICRSRGARLATRNTRDFVECGIDLINPWTL
ncbi:plasmid stabilization protein [Xaviernesmea oryzae]|uniref:Ribonuclease VapC n=1 Tax=Xaviernesmea oryzae TaxID=464029 RepID=A0A1Q9AVY0_9HYPH|nr:type II toxin-antitoxin system VapC family toxin [Xaviernesmea oryzae]OLP59616.1 plasmid stabilization protein [Xaviernesmea oryzae]SEM24768.1 hypothetical protein SAMN04487976_12460 [Xaviernesmea oryzae]